MNKKWIYVNGRLTKYGKTILRDSTGEITMIKMNTMNLNAHLDKIFSNLIGKTIKDVTAIKLDPTSESRWSHYDHSEFSGIRVWFTDDSMIEITQVLEPVDDENTHPENPLNIELVEYK